MAKNGLLSFRVQKNIFAFCVITFETIEVQICSAPQKDRLNHIFVNDIFVDDGKLDRNGRKTAVLANGWGRLPIDNKYAALSI